MQSYFLNLSPTILGVVAILVFFSVVSWSIMIWKSLQLWSASKDTRAFLDGFWKAPSLQDFKGTCGAFTVSPLVPVFLKGYEESQKRRNSGHSEAPGVDRIGRALRDAVSKERSRFEKNLSFLATTASVSPFVGLFGTVWGIMVAFNNIGVSGSTSLDVVAPGISEALVTTAIGLAVAIPATIGFNFFQNKVQVIVATVEDFTTDLDPMIRTDVRTVET